VGGPFLALPARSGEDGCIQGLLESMFIPYTGSGVLASSVGMEKVFAKQVFVAHATPPPACGAFDARDRALAGVESLPFPFPVVVKPSREGSSVGVQIVHTQDAYQSAGEGAA